MKTEQGLKTLALGLLIAGLGACESGTTPADAELPIDDVALIAADAALEDLTFMAGIPIVRSSALSIDGRGALERSRSVTWFDEAGNEMDGPDALLTASVHYESSVSGSMSRGPWSASVERSRSMTVSGLLGEEVTRTFDGSGSEHHARSRMSDESGTRAFEMSGSSLITSVVRAVDRAAQPWPLSGSIRRELSAQVTNGPNGDRSRARVTVLTFNGTQFATLTVDGEEFEVDLAARDGDRGVSRKDRSGG